MAEFIYDCTTDYYGEPCLIKTGGPIVRCEDCMKSSYVPVPGAYRCARHPECELMGAYDFCSYGERRADSGEA